MKRTTKPLSSLEHAVLTVLWDRAPATAEQVRLGLDRPLKESTIRTILKRLEDKGYARHSVDGRTNLYAATSAPSNVAVSAVRQIIDRFCGGSVEQLLLGMVDERVIDKAELKKLAERVARHAKKKETH
ncbi:MAG: BlaI/MecI/CopY family transcriptional regulator [Acidobacteria bacterium]|nr:BlaI/MecI/CopY family transcriptional regulator [Acidobacteriota bacterium]